MNRNVFSVSMRAAKQATIVSALPLFLSRARKRKEIREKERTRNREREREILFDESLSSLSFKRNITHTHSLARARFT